MLDSDEPQLWSATKHVLEHGGHPDPFRATTAAIVSEIWCTLTSLECDEAYCDAALEAAREDVTDAVCRSDRPLFAFAYDAVENKVTHVVGADRPAVLATVAEWERNGRPYRAPIDVARLREWIARTYFTATSGMVGASSTRPNVSLRLVPMGGRETRTSIGRPFSRACCNVARQRPWKPQARASARYLTTWRSKGCCAPVAPPAPSTGRRVPRTYGKRVRPSWAPPTPRNGTGRPMTPAGQTPRSCRTLHIERDAIRRRWIVYSDARDSCVRNGSARIGLAPGYLERVQASLADAPLAWAPRLLRARLGARAGVVGVADLARAQA
jgi:hypothetical protein